MTTYLPGPGPYTARAPRRETRWGPGMWAAVVALVLVESFVAFVALMLVKFGASTTCQNPADWSNVRSGELGLAICALVGFLPWAVATAYTRPRGRVVVVGLLAVSPLLVGLLGGLTPQAWSGSFCF